MSLMDWILKSSSALAASRCRVRSRLVISALTWSALFSSVTVREMDDTTVSPWAVSRLGNRLMQRGQRDEDGIISRVHHTAFALQHADDGDNHTAHPHLLPVRDRYQGKE